MLEGDGSHSAELWKGVAEMGWTGAAVPEEFGGAGFGRLELALIAQEIGRALAPIPFGPSVYPGERGAAARGQRRAAEEVPAACWRPAS